MRKQIKLTMFNSKKKNKMTKHFDLNFDHTPTTTQMSWIMANVVNNPLFSDHAIYVNSQYIGGRANDR